MCEPEPSESLHLAASHEHPPARFRRPRTRSGLEDRGLPAGDETLVRAGQCRHRREAECVALDIADHAAVIEFCQANKVDFVVVGPDAPIAAGIVDDLNAAGFKAFGPTKAAGQLESSKSFTKALCRANNIPTAAYEHFTDADKAKAYIREQGAPIVVKADGLAAGKGVVVAMTRARGARRRRHDVRRRFRRGRRRGRDRGIHGGRGGLVLRAVRRRARAAAGDRAGPQARLRRRPGAEHRRHGRLFAGAGADAKRSARR